MDPTCDTDGLRPAASDQRRPVDLAHLARQTMGNRDLEQEVLRLFLKQSERVMNAIAEPGADRATLAHTLLGSARGIGAHGVAEAAARLEAAARTCRGPGRGDLQALSAAVEDARRYILSLVEG